MPDPPADPPGILRSPHLTSSAPRAQIPEASIPRARAPGLTYAALAAKAVSHAPSKPVRLAPPPLAEDIPFFHERKNVLAYETAPLQLPPTDIVYRYVNFVATKQSESAPSLRFVYDFRAGNLHIHFRCPQAAIYMSQFNFEIDQISLVPRQLIKVSSEQGIMVLRVSKTPAWILDEAKEILVEALRPYGRVIHVAYLENALSRQYPDLIHTGQWQVGLETPEECEVMPPSVITVPYDNYEIDLRVSPPLRATWCSYCRHKGHTRSSCTKVEPCLNCGKAGHMKRNCRSKALPRKDLAEVFRQWRKANNLPEEGPKSSVRKTYPEPGQIQRDTVISVPNTPEPESSAQQLSGHSSTSTQSVYAEPHTPFPPRLSVQATSIQTPSKNLGHQTGPPVEMTFITERPSEDWAEDTQMDEMEDPNLSSDHSKVTARQAIDFDRIRNFEKDWSLLNKTTETVSSWGGRSAIIWRPSLSLEFAEAKNSDDGRISGVIMKIFEEETRLISVYVPVRDSDKIPFFKQLESFMTKWRPDLPTIMGGDWNCVEDDMKDTVRMSHHRDLRPGAYRTVGGRELKELVTHFGLLDSYRLKRPNTVEFTNRHATACRRLDRIYISGQWAEAVRSVALIEGAGSTHLMYQTTLEVGHYISGPSFYKCNTFWLSYEWFRRQLKQAAKNFILGQWKHESPLDSWDLFKSFIRYRYMQLSLVGAMLRENDPAMQKSFRFHSLRIRAGYPQGMAEVPNIQPLLERVRQQRQRALLRRVRDPEGNEVEASQINSMAGILQAHFSAIYEPVESENESLSDLWDLSGLSPIAQEDRDALDSSFSLDELEKATRICATASTPGPDGIPVEVYTAIWGEIKEIFAEMVEYSSVHSESTYTQKNVYMSLLAKQGSTDQASLQSWRSISLINVDSRIMSQAVVQRLYPILGRVISKEQHGFLPNRWIGDAVANVESILSYEYNQLDRHGVIAFIDFQKAYDKVSHNYLRNIVKRYGIGPRLRAVIETRFLGSHGHLTFNGWVSSSFPLLSGVRQGDPLSPLLFVMAVEPLIRALKLGLPGIKPSPYSQPVNVGAFADDVHMVVTNANEARTAARFLALYNKAGGGQVNQNKSVLMPTESNLENLTSIAQILPYPIQENDFRFLGVRIRNVDQWSKMRDKLARRLTMMSLKAFPIATRTLLINTFVFSTLVHLDSIHPAPTHILQEIEKLAANAVWGGVNKLHLVSHEVLTTPMPSGGFGLWCLKAKLAGARAKWMRKLTEEPSQPWQDAITHQATLINGHDTQWVPGTNHHTQWSWFTGFFDRWDRGAPVIQHERWRRFKEAFKNIFPQVSLSPRLRRRQLVHVPHLRRVLPQWLDEVIQDLALYRGTYKRIMNDPIFLQCPSDTQDANWWRQRWTTLQKVRQVDPMAAEKAQLLALRRLPHYGRFGAEWLRLHTTLDLDSPELCRVCLQSEDTLAHMFWECEKAQELWQGTEYTSLDMVFNGPLNYTMALDHAKVIKEWAELHHRLRFEINYTMPPTFVAEVQDRYKLH